MLWRLALVACAGWLTAAPPAPAFRAEPDVRNQEREREREDDGDAKKSQEVKVEVKLDRARLDAGKPIQGDLQFRVPKQAPGVAPRDKQVVLNGPQIAGLIDGTALPSVLSLVMDEGIPAVVEVGKQYKAAFRIQLSPRILDLLSGGSKALPLLPEGNHTVSLSVNSLESFQELNPGADFFGTFRSDAETFTVLPPGPKSLTAEDLLQKMAGSSNLAKGDLAEYYAYLKFPLDRLGAFTPVPERTLLSHSEPVFLHRLKPGEEWKVTCTPPFNPQLPNCVIRLGNETRAVPVAADLTLPAPSAPGIYRVQCTQHFRQHWGWILVRNP